MREFSIPFDEDTVVGVKLLVEGAPTYLIKAANELDKLTIKNATKKSILGALESVCPKDYARELLAFARGMRVNIDNYDFTTEEVLLAVKRGLVSFFTEGKNIPEANKTIPEAYEAQIPLFTRILNNPNVVYLSKVSILLNNNSKHLHNISIVTSTTPVFNEIKTIVIGTIIKNILYLTVSDRNENENLIEIPLGIEDLRRLQKQAEMGIKKTEILEKNNDIQNMNSITYKSHP